MNELVFKGANNQALTNSLLVAEKFGKSHKHVMQSIKDLITSAEKSANLFVESEYPRHLRTHAADVCHEP